MTTKILINGVDKSQKLQASRDSLVTLARNLAPTEALPSALSRVSTHVSKLAPETIFEVTDGEEANPLTVKFTARAIHQLSKLIEDGELVTVKRPSRGKNGGKKANHEDAEDAWA